MNGGYKEGETQSESLSEDVQKLIKPN